MKYTSGPWRTERNYGRTWISARKGRKRVQIADISDIETDVGSGETDTDNEQTQANARLIAAAPELLLALQQIDLAPLSHGDDAVNEMQRLARVVISKATGEGSAITSGLGCGPTNGKLKKPP